MTVTYNGSLPEFAMYITLYSLYSLWSKYILYLSVLAVSVFLPFCPSIRPSRDTHLVSVGGTNQQDTGAEREVLSDLLLIQTLRELRRVLVAADSKHNTCRHLLLWTRAVVCSYFHLNQTTATL